MKLITHIDNRLKEMEIDCSIESGVLIINLDGIAIRLRTDEELDEAFKHYRLAKSINFDTVTRCLLHNNSVEVPLTRLAVNYDRDLPYELSDSHGNSISILKRSVIYSLAHFDSDVYPKYFENVIRKRLLRSSSRVRPLSSLMSSPYTAKYVAKGRKRPANLRDIAISQIKSCLFKLSVEQRECLDIWKPKDSFYLPNFTDESVEDYSIPKAVYDDNVVSYYKVARSSSFPSQSYLDYFHVLEYHFLRVSEDKLHHQIRTMVNQTNFKANEDGLDKLISLVRKQDAKSDETEMLRSVIQKFVPEEEFIIFIKKVEEECEHKIYTKKRKIFGEMLDISAVEGHAISNAAKVLKHIRNAIVHSSDRYKREDCHIPLSESEDIIEEFIPLIRYVAEKVIYGTAT